MKFLGLRRTMDYTKDKFINNRKPKRPLKLLVPIKLLLCKIFLGGNKYKVNKINCDGLKPPFILVCNHASQLDFPIAYKCLYPHPTNWIVSIEEFVGRDWLMRSAGCFYKRKFTKDVMVVKNILHCVKRYNNNFVIYPEARYSLAGINERIDGALGKLAKMANVPVVFLKLKGNFLASPQWNKKPIRKLTLEADFEQIVTKEEIQTLSPEEVQARIEKQFEYDDYKWQFDNKIKITSKYRAHNLHKILYQCPICKQEFEMNSKETKLWCEHCGAEWEMDEYGRLNGTKNETVFPHVPDWYKWERQNVIEEVNSGNYKFSDQARLELLHSPKGYKVASNSITYTHDYNGFTVSGKLVNGEDFTLNRPVLTMPSCHIEYNFKKRGDAAELCLPNVTYFVFPLNKKNQLTKLHFATEALYDLALKNQDKPE